MGVYENIKYLAKGKGLKLADIEKKMGRRAGYISRRKSGITAEELSIASNILGESMDDLYKKDFGKSLRIEEITEEIERLNKELQELQGE